MLIVQRARALTILEWALPCDLELTHVYCGPIIFFTYVSILTLAFYALVFPRFSAGKTMKARAV